MKRRIGSLAIMVMMVVSLSACAGQGDTTNSPFQVKHTNKEDISTDTSVSDNTEDTAEPQTAEQPDTEDILTPDEFRPVELNDMYSSYRKILMDNETAIRAIDWQTRTYMWNGELDFSGYGYLEERIAFYDLTGDGVDEMIVLSGVPDEDMGYCYVADLDVYGSLNGSVQNLLHEDSFEVQVAGGTRMAVFGIKGSGLIIYDSMGDESWEKGYRKLYFTGSALETDESVSYYTRPNDDYSEMIESYRKNDADSSAAEYVSTVQSYCDQIDALLLQDMIDDEVVYSMSESVPNKAVTYDRALEYLNVRLQMLSATPVEDDFFTQIAGEYYFASGAGGWGTYMTVYADGSFDGSYHDSDMGDTGDEYPNGTVYLSNYHGKFKNPVAAADGTYYVELENLDYDGQGNVELEDGVRYIYSEPYGMAGSDLFAVYLEGTPMSVLPQDYIDWVAMPRAWGYDDSYPETLPFNGIYNVMQQEGFGQ